MGLRPLAYWDFGFESLWEHGCLSLVNVVCCQVEVSASGWSLVQRSPTERGVSECDREASVMRTPWPNLGYRAINKKLVTKNASNAVLILRCPIFKYLLCYGPQESVRKNCNWPAYFIHRTSIINKLFNSTWTHMYLDLEILHTKRKQGTVLISNFRHVLNVVWFLLGDSPASVV
jgi:hypothetical protein